VTRTVVALALRALRNFLRRPQFLAPLFIFPGLFLAVNTGGLHRATSLPGFPHVHSFFDFQLAAAITQSLMLGGIQTGIATALEIEGGFFDRLVASPIPRVAIVLGRLAAALVVAFVQVAFFLLLGLVFGTRFEGGAAGVALVLLIGSLAGMGFAGIGMTLALRAKNASIVQGIFPFVFVILFLSSAFFPRSLLKPPADWVARYNPLSYIADGMREPVIAALRAKPVLEGLLAAGAVALAMGGLSIHALRTRLREA
jgi:ABC-2 type transport system permease protein